VIATSDYDDVDWGEVQFSELDWSASADAGQIDWGEVQWNELDNTGVIATSDYDDIDWGEIQFNELDWSAKADAGQIDWGEVQWNELDAPDFNQINWEEVQYSELDSPDFGTMQKSLSASDVRLGSNAIDRVSGRSSADRMFGAGGNDALDGLSGDDRLFGCSPEAGGGRNEVDQLTGGSGRDAFVLGSSNGVFYDDGSARLSGRGDYALIRDFTPGQDRLVLSGGQSDYLLDSKSGVTGVSGSGLYYDSNDNQRLDSTDELVAVLQGGSGLSRTNTVASAQFV
jgi:Ca2+-binding RTX toxin-like protein